MSALLLTLFVSSVLAALGVLAFAWGVRQGEHDHASRLSLLPLDDDAAPAADPKG